MKFLCKSALFESTFYSMQIKINCCLLTFQGEDFLVLKHLLKNFDLLVNRDLLLKSQSIRKTIGVLFRRNEDLYYRKKAGIKCSCPYFLSLDCSRKNTHFLLRCTRQYNYSIAKYIFNSLLFHGKYFFL